MRFISKVSKRAFPVFRLRPLCTERCICSSCLLSTSLAWPAVNGCSRAENFSQLSSDKFTPLCTKSMEWMSHRKQKETKQQQGPASLIKLPKVKQLSLYKTSVRKCFEWYRAWPSARRRGDLVEGVLEDGVEAHRVLLAPAPADGRARTPRTGRRGGTPGAAGRRAVSASVHRDGIRV